MLANPKRQNLVAPKPTTAPQLRLVKEQTKKKTKFKLGPLVIAFSIAMILISFAEVWLVVDGIHQQSKIDQIGDEITELNSIRLNLVAQRAWHDSPVGLTDTATKTGFVSAIDVPLLPVVAEGELAPPEGTNPFSLNPSEQ